jgi:tetratricopeptide (TPR) repeat protein
MTIKPRAFTAALLFTIAFPVAQFAAAQTSRDYALCEGHAGNPEDAVAACTIIIQSGKHDGAALASAYLNRGHHLGRKKDHDAAIRDFDETLRLNPRNAQGWNNRGTMYGRKKQYERALTDHTKAIELDNNHKDAWYNRGFIYEMLGNKERAISDYRQALRVNPNDEDAKAGLRDLGAEP